MKLLGDARQTLETATDRMTNTGSREEMKIMRRVKKVTVETIVKKIMTEKVTEGEVIMKD